MIERWRVGLAFAGLWVVWGAAAQASTGEGVDWLLAHRAADGSHGRVQLRDTAAAAEAYTSMDAPSSLDDPEGLYLDLALPLTHDGLAHRLLGLSQVGADDPLAAESLSAAQNPDGGWGVLPGWQSDVWDTSLAVESLATSGHGGLPALGAAVAWLEAEQGPDGGWAFESNTSSVVVTARVLQSLNAVSDLFDLASTLEAGAAFLLAQQRSDGAIGSSSHVALDTAQSLVALAPLAVDAGAFSDAISWLSAAQLADGSWDADAYTTARAVVALSGEKPNFEIAAVTVLGAGSTPPVEGDPTTVTVTVRNNGRLPSAAPVSLELHRILEDGATLQLIGRQTVPALAAGSDVEISLPFTTTGIAGDIYLRTTVDVGAAVSETDERDNTFYSGVYIIPRVDVSVTAEDLDVVPEDAGLEEPVALRAVVRNRGGTDAADVVVQVWLGTPEGGQRLTQQTLDLPAGGAATVEWEQIYPKGDHTLTVVVDATDVVRESLENNNRAQVSFSVSERYDFAGSFDRIWTSAEEVVEPTGVNVTALFYNLREDTATNVSFQCYAYNTLQHDVTADREPLGPPIVVPELPGNGSATINCTFPTRGWVGRNYIYVVADPEDTFSEIREDNNEAAIAVFVHEQPNLLAAAVNPSTVTYTEGQTANLGGAILNTGGVVLKNVPVAIYVGDPSAGGQRLSPTLTLATLNPDQQLNTATLPWNTTGLDAGTYTLYAVADPDGLLTESLESDNRVSRTITLNPRADLSITAEDITFLPIAPEEGDTVTVSAVVRNLSTTTASGTFLVRVWDGDPAAGGTMLVEQSRASLSAGGSFTVSVDWPTSEEVGTHTFYVQVDPTEVISERFRTNNTASDALIVAASSRPDLAVAAADLSFSPPRGVSPSQTVTASLAVHNLRNRAASQVKVRLYAGDPAAGGTPLVPDVTVDVPALGQTTATLQWTTPASLTATTLYLKVDPDNQIAETNEANNTVSAPYKSRLQAGTQPTGLTASVSYRTVSLGWAASPASGVVGYGVYRDGQRLNTEGPLAPTSALGDSESSSFPASAAIDGSASTYWRGGSHAAPWWLQVDLPGAKVLTEVAIDWHSSYRGADYEIQGWNGAAWETLAAVTSNTSNAVTHRLTRLLNTSRYRVYATRGANSSYLGIYELRLTGFDGAAGRTYSDVDVLAGEWTYTVTAFVDGTWESPDSNPVDVTLAVPAAPATLTATPTFTRVDLTWARAEDPGFLSYLVWRDGALLNAVSDTELSGATAAASSVSSTSYAAANAVDGSTSTYWRSSAGAPQTWEVDLGGVRLLDGITLNWQGSYYGVDYVVQGWGGDAWVDLSRVEDNGTDTVTHAFAGPYPTRKVRVAISAGVSASYVGIEEVGLTEVAYQTQPSYADTSLTAGPYTYAVAALNRLGEVGVQKTASADVPVPAPPASLTATPGTHAMTLSWPAVSNPSSTGYLVYRDGKLQLTSTPRQALTGTVATASASDSASYLPEKALDTSASSYWRTGEPGDAWWQIDLPTTQVLTGVEIDWQSSYPAQDYRVQGWDGRYWRDVVTAVGNTTAVVKHPFPRPFASSRFRIYVTARVNATYLGLAEVRWLGFAPHTGTTYTDTGLASGAYGYGVSILNTVGEESAARQNTGTLTLPAPSGFTATVTHDDVDLAWSAAPGAAVVGYRVSRDGEVLNPLDAAVDLADGAVGTSSADYAAGYTAAEALDNSTSTRWIGASAQGSWSLDVTLPAPREIGGVAIDWYSGARPASYQVQVWSGGVWVTKAVISGTGDNAVVHRVAGVVTDRVRVFVPGGSGVTAPAITELRLLPFAPVTSTRLADPNVMAGLHTWGLRSVDTYGGVSAELTTQATVGSGPVAPTLTSASTSGGRVDLAWSASPSSGVLGYWAFRDGARIGETTNRAALATPIASSTFSTSTAYQPTNAIDGNTSTRWRSGSGSSWSLELRWPSSYKFDQVTLRWGVTEFARDYVVEAWDGAAWRVEAVVTANTSTFNTVPLPSALRTDRLRVSVLLGNTTQVEIYEVQAWEPTLITGTTHSDQPVHNLSYDYCVKAVAASFVSPCSNTLRVNPAEAVPPAAPANPRVSAYTKTNVSLAWDPTTATDLWGYRVYYQATGLALNSPPQAATTYTHTSIIKADTTSYTWWVTAVDVNGNESGPSVPVTFAPAPLNPPTNVAASVHYQDVTVTWTAHGDPLVASYSLLRDGAALTSGVTAATYTDVGVDRGTHTYQVAAVDLFGRTGSYSTPVPVELTDVDLAVADTSVFFLPQGPSELDDVKIHVSVRNNGERATPAASVAFYDGDPAAGGVLLGGATLPPLAVGELGVAYYVWALGGQAGDHEIFAVVDPANNLVEFAEDNNTARHLLSVSEVPELKVNITSVTADDFPEVTVRLNVTDPSGEPVVHLDERSLFLYEDDVEQSPLTIVENGDEGYSDPVVDIVFMIDSSGSMDEEWALVPELLANFEDELEVRGIAAESGVYSLGAASHGYDATTTGWYNGQASVVSSEDWGPSTTWHCLFYGWRPDAVRIVVPVSDEDAYDGSGYSAADTQTINEAIEACAAEDVLVFPLWGDGAAQTVIDSAEALGAGTSADAFYYENINEILEFMLLSVVDRVAQYEVTYTTSNDLRDGTLREVAVEASYRGASGVGLGEYTAPADEVLDLAAVEITTDPLTPVAGQAVEVRGRIRNGSALTLLSVPAALVLEQDDGTELQLGGIQDVGPLEAGEEATFTGAWVAVPGVWTLAAVADPEGLLTERQEANNRVEKALRIPGSDGVELAVYGQDMALDPPRPVGGDVVRVSGVVHNFGLETTNVLVQLYHGDPLAGGVQIGRDQLVARFPAFTSVPVAFDWDTTGLDGAHPLHLRVDPYDRIPELSEANNQAILTAEIVPPPYSVEVVADQASYGARAPATFTATVTNHDVADLTGIVRFNVEGRDGAVVEQVAEVDLGTVLGNPLPAWAYYVGVTADSLSAGRAGAQASAEVDFGAALVALGDTGEFAPASLRVVEHDASGRAVANWPARFVRGTSRFDRGKVLWPTTPPPATVGASRAFRIYFDTVEAAHPAASALPSSDDLLVFADDAGTLLRADRQADGTFSAAYTVATHTSRIRTLVVADVDGDGRDDIVAGDYAKNVVPFYAQVGGGFVAGDRLGGDNSAGDVLMLSASDIDDDGDQDLLYAVSTSPLLLLNDGAGVFTRTSLGAAASTLYSSQMADLDADGREDLIVGVNGGRVGWYQNLGAGSFAAYTQLVAVSGNAPYGLAVADFDGDAVLDLVFNDGSTGRGYFARGLGGSSFGTPARVTSLDTSAYTRYHAVDYNADAKADLVTLPTSSSSSPVQLRAGAANGGFGSPTVLHTFPRAAYAASASGPLEIGLKTSGGPRVNTHASTEVVASWNTGDTHAGPYQVGAHLLQGTDERGRDVDPFDIGSVLDLGAEVATDWPEYTPFERALISAALTNVTPNDAVAPTEGLVTVTDPNGVVVLRESYVLSELGPGEVARWSVQHDLYEAPSGTYRVRLTGLSDGIELGSDETSFVVISSLLEGIEGALVVDPSQALLGDPLALAWTMKNRGNTDLRDLPAFVDVVAEGGADVLASFPFEVDLDGGGGESSGDFAQASEVLGLGTFDARLGVELDGQWVYLAAARFDIVNLTGTLSVAPEVGEGGVDTFTVGWGVHNRADGALTDVALRIALTPEGGGAALTLSDFTVDLDAGAEASGEELQPSATLSLGRYVATLLNVRGEDTLTLAEASFEVVDTHAPVSTLTWSGVLVEAEGRRYAPSATRYLITAADTFSGVAAILYQTHTSPEATYLGPIQLVAEGPSAITWHAVDRAGVAEAARTFEVVVDDSPPVAVVSPLDVQPCTRTGASLSWLVTDLSPTTTVATLDGAPYVAGTPLTTEGVYTFSLTATDVLGHLTTREIGFEVSDDPCACDGSVTTDGDGDGVRACEGDCDDTRGDVFPGAVETCDGEDEDCDLAVDEDVDGDGAAVCLDCDEGDPEVYPGAEEEADGRDNDCDGPVDEGLCVEDGDGDGFTTYGGDCDDTDPTRHPRAPEAPEGGPNGIDDDCDGRVDDTTTDWDDDGDGASEAEGDCVDSNPAIGPSIPEAPGVFYTDGIDNNCDGVIDAGASTDADGDGFTTAGGDCADTDPTRYPGAPEGDALGAPDGIDNNCDGRVDDTTTARDDDFDGASEQQGDCDDRDAAVSPGAAETYDGRDEDCDGVADEGVRPCDLDGDGFTELAGDCDDTNPAIHPDATEVCDAVDNTCDGEVDEGGVCVIDRDGDGFTPDGGDCDDLDEDVNPDAEEVCNTRDDDCDGQTDEGDLCVVDEDGDGHPEEDDCDDTDASIHPGAAEVCDGVDQDCDDDVDEGVATSTWYRDDDDDGYGDVEGDPVEACAAPDGYVGQGGDCDDGDPAVHPGAADNQCDNFDDDCDGTADEDCTDLPPTPTQGTPVSATPTVGDDGTDCTCASGDLDGRSTLGLGALALLGLLLRRRRP